MQLNCQSSLLYIIRLMVISGGFAYMLWHPTMQKGIVSRYIWLLCILMSSVYYINEKTIILISKERSLIDNPDSFTLVTLITFSSLILINVCATIKLLHNSPSLQLLFNHFSGVLWNNKYRLSISHALILICFLCATVIIAGVDIILEGAIYYSWIRADALLLWLFIIIWETRLCLRHLNKGLQRATELSTLKQIRRYHSYVCSVVDAINKNYGIIIMISVFTSISGGSQTILMIPKDRPFADKISLYLHYISFTFYIVLIAIAGQALKKEGEHTLTVCYDRLQEFGLSKNNDFRKQLLNMTQQAFEQNLQISASGFYLVDHSLIVFICINTCTYMIVVFQFMTRNAKSMVQLANSEIVLNFTVH